MDETEQKTGRWRVRIGAASMHSKQERGMIQHSVAFSVNVALAKQLERLENDGRLFNLTVTLESDIVLADPWEAAIGEHADLSDWCPPETCESERVTMTYRNGQCTFELEAPGIWRRIE